MSAAAQQFADDAGMSGGATKAKPSLGNGLGSRVTGEVCVSNLSSNKQFSKTLPLPLPGPSLRNWRDWLEDNIAKGKRDNFMVRVDVGPDLASVLLLDFNNRNRPLRINGAEEWAARINRDEWIVTSQGISLGEDGQLNNGQHRLAGIVASGRTVQCWMMFGEPVEAFYVLDTQRTRSAADALHILNEKSPHLLSAAARLLLVVSSTMPRTMNSNVTRSINHAKIAETVMANPKLRNATAHAFRFSSALPKSSSAGAAVAWYLINERSARADKLPEFWDIVCSGIGILKERDACNVLRRAIQTGKVVRAKGAAGPYVSASIIIAWNLWAWGKQANGISWPDREPFPVPR